MQVGRWWCWFGGGGGVGQVKKEGVRFKFETAREGGE